MKLSGQIKIYIFFREANYYPNPSLISFFLFLFISLIVHLNTLISSNQFGIK